MNIYLEIFGYVGTAIVLLSMMMTSVVKLRIYNVIGSLISMTYAFLCSAWPVVLLNLGLILINVIQLCRLGKASVSFTCVKVCPQDRSLAYFLEQQDEDIRRYIPQWNIADDSVAYMVYTGNEVAGVFVAEQKEDGLAVQLDYTGTKYRDCSVAAYLLTYLKEQGVQKLESSYATDAHKHYLVKMGFAEENGVMIKHL